MEFSQGAKVEYRIQSSSVDQWQLTGNKVEEAQAVRMRALTISHVAGTAVMSPKEYLCSVIKHRRTHPAKQVTLFWILHRKNLWLREVWVTLPKVTKWVGGRAKSPSCSLLSTWLFQTSPSLAVGLVLYYPSGRAWWEGWSGSIFIWVRMYRWEKAMRSLGLALRLRVSTKALWQACAW